MRGSIALTFDPGTATASSRGFDPNTFTMVMGEFDPDTMSRFGTNMITGTLLLPRYAAVTEAVEGDLLKFKQMYQHQLETDEDCRKFLAIILKSVYDGKHILIFTTKGEFEIFGPEFSEFLLSYGIRMRFIELPGSMFSYTQPLWSPVENLMMAHGLLSVPEYLFLVNREFIRTSFDDILITRIMNDLGISRRRTRDEDISFLVSYHDSMEECGKVLELLVG
jgi:hypothetical protein